MSLPVNSMMPFSSKTMALICAAGVGSRAGGTLPKQYQSLNGLPMLVHTIAAFAQTSCVSDVLVVIGSADEWFDELVAPHLPAGVMVARVGGASRAISVSNGLQFLKDSGKSLDHWVMVHDAARPCIRPELIQRLFDGVCLAQADGGLLALPVVDTVKLAEPLSDAAPDVYQVRQTLKRDELWLAQTPQMFGLGALLTALSHTISAENSDWVTDEASVMESIGVSPLLVAGHVSNLKVTCPEDFLLAEFWLNHNRT